MPATAPNLVEGGLRRVVGHLRGHVQRHQTGLKPSQIGGQSKYTAIPERDHIVADARVRSSPVSNPNNRLIYWTDTHRPSQPHPPRGSGQAVNLSGI